MSRYVPYQTDNSMTTNVFKSKDPAIGVAHCLLDIGCGDELQVGPMLESLEGDILNADDLQQIDCIE